MEIPTKLFIRNLTKSDIGNAMLIHSVQAFQDFGREVLNRRFEVAPSDKNSPDIRNYISNGVLDADSYHFDIFRFYESNPQIPIFSLDIIDEPIMTEHFGQVYATSMPYLDLDTGKIISKHHHSVVLSTNPLFLDNNYETASARAYLLTWHENGHLIYNPGENCIDESCIMSHPRDKKKSLDRKVKHILSGGKFPICDNCKNKLDEFREQLN